MSDLKQISADESGDRGIQRCTAGRVRPFAAGRTAQVGWDVLRARPVRRGRTLVVQRGRGGRICQGRTVDTVT